MDPRSRISSKTTRCSGSSKTPGSSKLHISARVPLLIFTGALGLLALTRAVGLAVFAMLPNSLDQRGPAVLIRTILSFALLAPPAIMSSMEAVVLGAPIAVTAVTGTLIAIAEASILVTFAAWRLAGRVDRLSLA